MHHGVFSNGWGAGRCRLQEGTPILNRSVAAEQPQGVNDDTHLDALMARKKARIGLLDRFAARIRLPGLIDVVAILRPQLSHGFGVPVIKRFDKILRRFTDRLQFLVVRGSGRGDDRWGSQVGRCRGLFLRIPGRQSKLSIRKIRTVIRALSR